MSEELAISLRGVSKCFKRYDRPIDRLKELLIPGKSRAQEFWALRDIDLDVPKGQTLGIVGRNGSGKSTLLQIIAGTLTPTTGTVQVNGRVSALLELGSGFNPEFTGRQNVFFNGQLLGLTKAEVEERFDTIAAFADIGDFIDQPVKTYSSGMFVRLAFAVAIHVDPDILIVDEALAVGDGIFVHRCMARIYKLQNEGGSIIFVSHDTDSVTRLCSKAVWIKDGKIQEIDAPRTIIQHYQAFMYEEINLNQPLELNKVVENQNLNTQLLTIEEPKPKITIEEPKPKITIEEPKPKKNSHVSTQSHLNHYTQLSYLTNFNSERFGTGKAEILEFSLVDSNGDPLKTVYPHQAIKCIITVCAFDVVARPIIGCVVYDRLRTAITGFNTYQMFAQISPLRAFHIYKYTFEIQWPPIAPGSYLFEPAIADGTQNSHEILDWVQCAYSLNSALTPEVITFGLMKLDVSLFSVEQEEKKSKVHL